MPRFNVPKQGADQEGTGGHTGLTDSLKRSVSRREFLRMAGIAGATIGVGASLGGLVAGCGGEEAATTTTAPAESTTTSQSESTTTSVAADVEMGDEIKMGFVAPITGSIASFGVPDEYCADRWREYCGDGLVCGDGKKHPVSIELTDSQSDSNRAAQVAGDLINNSKVDIMMVASTPDTVTPVVEQCEANGCPVVSTDCPWQTYLGQNTEYKWSYHAFFGIEDFAEINWSCYEQIASNKVVGAMYDNTADGNTFGVEGPRLMAAKGYTVVQPDNYQALTEDFTAQISQFKKEGVELIMGNMLPPDFTNFWKQAIQQGLSVKACLVGKAILFPASVEALGDVANGLMTELWWHRTFPWTSSLTGETCAQLADDFEATTGQQQTAPLLHYVCGEMAIHAVMNSTNPKDKEAVLAAIQQMKFDTIVGPVDFTADIIASTGSNIADWPVGPGRKTKNVYDPGLGGSQWLMQGGTWTFDSVPIDKAAAPFMLDSSLQSAKTLPIES
jgi:branched-chain amino acid transport system substrate-binding protein